MIATELRQILNQLSTIYMPLPCKFAFRDSWLKWKSDYDNDAMSNVKIYLMRFLDSDSYHAIFTSEIIEKIMLSSSKFVYVLALNIGNEDLQKA